MRTQKYFLDVWRTLTNALIKQQQEEEENMLGIIYDTEYDNDWHRYLVNELRILKAETLHRLPEKELFDHLFNDKFDRQIYFKNYPERKADFAKYLQDIKNIGPITAMYEYDIDFNDVLDEK